MVFQCQVDSFQTEYTTSVVSCEKNAEEGYDVICKDTILFPEGGGQPWDLGSIDGCPVKRVTRKGDQAIHVVEMDFAFEAGQTVIEKLDWPRRKDHMQQHSGQHLISAIFDNVFQFPTKSWWLGSETSYIEMDPKHEVTEEIIKQVEDLANQYIFEGRSVSVAVFNSLADITSETMMRATKGLPKDHVGHIRMINIDGVDSNLCCGTHVDNLRQLQAVKFLHLEKPSKNKQLLHFLVGSRVLEKLHVTYKQELAFNQILNGGPASHIDLLEKMRASVKRQQKALKSLSKDVALLEALQLKAMEPSPKFYICRKNSDLIESTEFVNCLARKHKEMAPETVLIVVIESNPSSQLFIYSADKIPTEVAADICKSLDAKGEIKGDRFQTKFNNLKGLKHVEKLLGNCFEAN